MQTLLVSKTDPSDLTLATVEPRPLAPGEVRLSIDSFAITANNVTYMIFGEQIGYWQYFDPAAYGFGEPGQGRMPVWGYATVTESRCGDVASGTRVYGFLPVADTLVVRPVKVGAHGFQDGADHRASLHPVYNSYSRLDSDPSFGVQPALQPVLRPLFTTSFLIDDFLASEDMFGASTVVLTSASSKTALGTAFCLSKREGVDVVGLTSARNKAFVESTGYYTRVLTYDAVNTLEQTPTVVVDMAGNGALMSRLYAHLGDRVVYACSVGKSHWQGDSAPKPEAGAPLKLFFAPDYARARMQAWGADGFASRIAERWVPFLHDAALWLEVDEPQGVEGLLQTYKALLDGSSDPRRAALFTLSGASA